MKYIDADKLIAKIKRQQRKLIVQSSHTKQVDIRRDCALQNGVYDYILGIIDSLQQEQTRVELEKEMKETVEIAEEHAMLAGRIQMEEEMKKKAIEGTLDGNHLILHYSDLAEVLPEGKSSDRVKAIIVKIDDGN